MMMAYVVDNVVIVVHPDPVSVFGPEFGALFIPCPDDVQNYWIHDPILNTFAPPPPPPLVRSDFKSAFTAFRVAKADAALEARFEALLALSPNYPALPGSLEDFIAIMNTVEWPA